MAEGTTYEAFKYKFERYEKWLRDMHILKLLMEVHSEHRVNVHNYILRECFNTGRLKSPKTRQDAFCTTPG